MFRLIRGCATLIGFAVLALAGWTIYQALHKPAPAGPTPVPSATSAAIAANFDRRVASAEVTIRQDAAAGRHEPMSFTITDAEMTARVNKAIADGQVQVPVSDVLVKSVPGQINIQGQANASVVTAPFTMVAVPQVSAGKAQLRVISTSFGPVSVPPALSSQLSAAVGSDNLLGDLPFTVTSFRAEQGQVVLEGTT